MAINLKKGGRVDLKKQGFTRGMVGLGWDTNRYQGSAEFDLDLVVFECDAQKRCIDEKHIVFYKSPVYGTPTNPEKPERGDPEGAILHSGDNRTGEGDGDDETAKIDLTKISAKVESLIIAVTIYEARERNQNFGLVSNAYVRMVDENGTEVLRYDLSEDFSVQTSVIFAEIKRYQGDWRFCAIGEGYEKELADLCKEYGLEVED